MVWSNPYNGLFFILLALGLAGSLVLAFRFASAPNARNKAIIALRATALGTLVLILLNPTRIQETRQTGEQPAAIFLLDESRSMSLETPRSRAQSGSELIRQTLFQIPAGRRPTIRRFGFGAELGALADNDDGLSTRDDQTRLNLALEQLAGRFGDALPFGVFVFSDGRATDGEALDATAGAYRELGVPVHVVALGDERVSGDVAISDLDAPREAGPGTRVPVRVTLRSRGFAGTRAELSIRSASDAHGQPIATLPLTLAEGEQAAEIVIETDRAKGQLTAEISSFPREAVASNNSVAFQISPRDTRLRVIYMEGTGAGEYRFLHDALQEDPNIKCMSMQVGNQYEAVPRLSRIDEPGRGYPMTREELFGYDVVICSDIPRTSFTPAQLAWTVELVAKRGGGFAMIGGNTSFGSGGWDQTAWDGLIPVDMSGNGPARSENYWGTLRVVIPPQAIDHPIWRIVDDPERNRQVLSALPMFYGTNLTDRLKPAATALGVSAGPLSGSRIATVFSCQTFGAAGHSPCRATPPSIGVATSSITGVRATTGISASSGGTSFSGLPRTARPARHACESKPTRSSIIRARRFRSPREPTMTGSRRRTGTGWSPVFARRTNPNRAVRRVSAVPSHRSRKTSLIEANCRPRSRPRSWRAQGRRCTDSAWTWPHSTATESWPSRACSFRPSTIRPSFTTRGQTTARFWSWPDGPGEGRSRVRPTWRTLLVVILTQPSAWSSTAGRSGTIRCSGCSCWGSWPRNGFSAGERGWREKTIRSMIGLARLHLDLELLGPVGDDALEPFRRIADSPRSSLRVLDVAVDMLGQDRLGHALPVAEDRLAGRHRIVGQELAHQGRIGRSQLRGGFLDHRLHLEQVGLALGPGRPARRGRSATSGRSRGSRPGSTPTTPSPTRTSCSPPSEYGAGNAVIPQ